MTTDEITAAIERLRLHLAAVRTLHTAFEASRSGTKNQFEGALATYMAASTRYNLELREFLAAAGLTERT